jgi:hypothetical protein
MMNKDFWHTPWLSKSEKVGLHVLYLCCMRSVVQSYGGVMEIDSAMRRAAILVPTSQRVACLEALEHLKLEIPKQLPIAGPPVSRRVTWVRS